MLTWRVVRITRNIARKKKRKMLYDPVYFDLDELVCEHVYDYFGKRAFMFFDPRLLITIDRIREVLNKPIYINNWQIHGEHSQRGLRCTQCDLVKKAVDANQLYMSAHMEGQAVDFDVLGLVAEEVRQWIIKNQKILPYSIRLETDVSWVHLDCRQVDERKIILFNNI
jgi:hypothetical protein